MTAVFALTFWGCCSSGRKFPRRWNNSKFSVEVSFHNFSMDNYKRLLAEWCYFFAGNGVVGCTAPLYMLFVGGWNSALQFNRNWISHKVKKPQAASLQLFHSFLFRVSEAPGENSSEGEIIPTPMLRWASLFLLIENRIEQNCYRFFAPYKLPNTNNVT